MKLLLTSNGLSNASIADALEELVGKPRKETRIIFIPTAAFPQDEDKHEARDWLVDDMHRIKEFCGFIDIVSLADLPKAQVLDRLEYADVIFVGGGNTFYLSYCMQQAGLFEELPRLLEGRVYAGISAGSIVAGQSLVLASQALKNPQALEDEDYDLLGPKGQASGKALKLVDFLIRPHLNNRYFSLVRKDLLEEKAKEVKLPFYALDDDSALKVDGGRIEVVSEGEWLLLNGN